MGIIYDSDAADNANSTASVPASFNNPQQSMSSFDANQSQGLPQQQQQQQQNPTTSAGDVSEAMGYKQHFEVDADPTYRNPYGIGPGAAAIYGYPRRPTDQPQSGRHIFPKEFCDSSNPHQQKISDQSHAVESFFAGFRVPASFITGVSFKELFTNYEHDNDSDIQRYLQAVCIICQGFAFVLSLSVIMLSSSALIRGLESDFNPYARNGYELLFREFHFEFLCVRWCFNISLFAFLLAVGCKMLYEFQLFDVNGDDFERWRLEVGIAVVLIVLALTLHLGSCINSTLIGWANQWDMTVDLIRVLVHRGVHEDHPMEAVSLVVLGAGIFFFILALIPGAQI